MLAGSSPVGAAAPGSKKGSSSPFTGGAQHTFIPVNSGSSPMIRMAVQGAISTKASNSSPQLVMIRAPSGNTTPPVKGQSILVPVNPMPDGKFVQTGGPVIRAPYPSVVLNANNTKNQGHGLAAPQSILVPLSTGCQQSKSVLVPAMQSSRARVEQQSILIPSSKSGSRGTLVMVPVTTPSTDQAVTFVSSGKHRGIGSAPPMLTQQGLKPGLSLIPVPERSASKGDQKLVSAELRAVTQASAHPKLVAENASPIFTKSPTDPKTVNMDLPSKRGKGPSTVFIPDSALASLPKGTQLIPIPSPQLASKSVAFQVPSSAVGAMQGARLVFAPGKSNDRHLLLQTSSSQSVKSPTGKNVVIVGGQEGNTILATSKSSAKPSVVPGTVPGDQKVQVVYRNLGASRLPSMLNKPIQPKPTIETTESFFKTPIEIKPLEEDGDADLDEVLNALQGGGAVDLVPLDVPTPSTSTQPKVAATPPNEPFEDMGLRIDSVYSLSNDSSANPGSQKGLTQEDSSNNEDSKEDESSAVTDGKGSNKKASEAIPVTIAPVLPEDEPSQSGDTTPGFSLPQRDEVGADVEDPKERLNGRVEEDQNLMRGDCLQVRLAKQAARQLQEQMRQDAESYSLVQAEWDEDNSKKLGSKDANNDNASARKDATEPEHTDTTTIAKMKGTSIIGIDGEKETTPGSIKKHSKLSTLKNEENSSSAKSDKPDNIDDEAQNVLVAAARNGCEVADDDLNDMFDELISEYLTTPERPKPSVRVRGIDECKTFLEDPPQSLVTTHQTKPKVLDASVLPRILQQESGNLKPRTVKTAKGTVTLIPVRVPVPGQPGNTKIKYIPMQLPTTSQNNTRTTIPQLIKTLPMTTPSKVATEPIALSKASLDSPQFVKVVTSTGTRTLVSPSVTTSSVSPVNKSLLKLVMADVSSSTSMKPAPPPSSGLTNEEISVAVQNARKNVLGDNTKNVPGKPSVPSTITSPRPTLFSHGKKNFIIFPKSTGDHPNARLVVDAPQLLSTLTRNQMETSAATLPAEAVPIKKKKKKKKKQKKMKPLPPTKECSVVLRRLNMKVVRNKVNLRRVKKALLFEAVSRQPSRGVKRKACEMAKEVESPQSKRTREEKAGTDFTTAAISSSIGQIPATSTVFGSVTTTQAGSAFSGTDHSVLPTFSHKTGAFNSTSLVSRVNNGTTPVTSGSQSLYQIMAQLPLIKPAVPGAPRPSPSQIMAQAPVLKKVVSHMPTNPTKPVLSPPNLLGHQLAAAASASTASKGPVTSTITLTLSCTKPPTPLSARSVSSLSVCTSGSSSTTLTTTAPAPVLSPPNVGPKIPRTSPSRPLGTTGQVTIPAAPLLGPNLPRMPTLQVASKLVPRPTNVRMSTSMPSLRPAPRSILIQGQEGAVSRPGEALKPSVPRPGPPVVSSSQGIAAPGSQTAGNNKRYLLIKTSAGQFLVPVSTGQVTGTSSTSSIPSTSVSPTTISSATQEKSTVSLSHSVQEPIVATRPPQKETVDKDTTGRSTPTTLNTCSVSDRIKEEPADMGYSKYEHPVCTKTNQGKDNVVKEENVSDEDMDGSEEPRVPASLNHRQKIEELKARLREHEEQLEELRKKREDTKRILESLDQSPE